MIKIPFLDIKEQYQSIKEEVLIKIEEVCESAAFSNGPYVHSFEENYAKYCGVKYAIALNSGTSALHLSMIALGISEGDEVIIPANTFIATAWAPSYVGAKPIFVDCKPMTWQIDPIAIEKNITERTKAIIGVHLYGQPFDVDLVRKIADKYNLFLVEDAAQAHGAKYNNKAVGSFGDLACFSFYPGKNLGTYGEGGCITTNNEKYDCHIRSLLNHGSHKKYYHEEIGYNMRMGGIEGAILDIKLKYLDNWNDKRKKIAKIYQNGIKNSKIQLQKQPEFSDSVYHLFVITSKDRAKLIKYLTNNDIIPGIHYPIPCHLQKAFQTHGHLKGDFPITEDLSNCCLSLPMYPELQNSKIKKVIKMLNQY